MTLHLTTADGDKTLFARGIKTPGGNKEIAKISILTPDGDKVVFEKSAAIPSLTVTVDLAVVTGVAATRGGGPIPIVTNACTVSASGGTAPYTHSWALDTDDGDGGTWTAKAPTSATTAFQASAVALGASSTAIFIDTVTDARGATGSVTVTAGAGHLET